MAGVPTPHLPRRAVGESGAAGRPETPYAEQ